MITFYYRFWAQIQNFSPTLRVMIVMAVFSVILFLFLLITYKIWKRLWLWISMKLLCVWHIMVSDYFFDVNLARSNGERARNVRRKQNKFADKIEKQYEKKQQMLHLVKEGGKTFGFGWGILIYLLLVTSIVVPKETNISFPLIGGISHRYEDIERTALATAHFYEPLLKTPEHEIEAEEVENHLDDEDVVYLKLNKKGWDGANIRKEARQSSPEITTVQGDSVMIRLRQSDNGNWILVELENGVQGWIHHTLVEEKQ